MIFLGSLLVTGRVPAGQHETVVKEEHVTLLYLSERLRVNFYHVAVVYQMSARNLHYVL